MQKITTNLWFAGNAKEAVDFYVSIFPSSKILNTGYYPKTAEEGLAEFQLNLAGEILVIEFELSGQKFTAINADNTFKFTEAISLNISCKDQEEIDYYWSALTKDDGKESVCGWLKDKYGLSWQVNPENMGELMKKPGSFAKMMQMKKIIVADF